jgi:hypothetical protein
MPVPVRDWISSAFRHAGNTALTLPHRNPGQPARRAPAEHKPHQGLPLTGTARRTRRHASSSGIPAARQGSLPRGPAHSWAQNGKRSIRITYLTWSTPLRLSGYPRGGFHAVVERLATVVARYVWDSWYVRDS